ncbi:hypothetical protein [Massilia genomosp. 1]|uniref:Uncharacterized protein n=1 Tax=Massilia genomosp. 1 TaxID=2609280 RepID=A0ABX0N2J1_9BURK|nr:hypothetical protein [Massilia genomosp. 1]NHZ66275.1 hypothetical protein [Massilia genomosp. 1]
MLAEEFLDVFQLEVSHDLDVLCLSYLTAPKSALNSEVAMLGHPRAALLAFGVAVLAHNVPAVIERAIMIRHRLEQGGKIELSASISRWR